MATIWRILSRRGFVTPQPQKRPRSSFVRFCADQPNERWQADITHWALAGGTHMDILNMIDDHSRLLVASDARTTTKAADVVASFHRAATSHGYPASMLTDNGAVFTAAYRGGGRCAIEVELAGTFPKCSQVSFGPKTYKHTAAINYTLQQSTPAGGVAALSGIEHLVQTKDGVWRWFPTAGAYGDGSPLPGATSP